LDWRSLAAIERAVGVGKEGGKRRSGYGNKPSGECPQRKGSSPGDAVVAVEEAATGSATSALGVEEGCSGGGLSTVGWSRGDQMRQLCAQNGE